MKRLFLVFFLSGSLMAMASCAGSQEKDMPSTTPTVSAETTSENPEQTIDRLEHEWVQAIVAKDTSTIDRILADDFVGTTDSQMYSKADAIEDVQTGVHESLDMSNVNVRVFNDAAVVTLTQNEKSHHGTEDFSGSYLFTNVWVKRNGEWRAVASHGSRVR